MKVLLAEDDQFYAQMITEVLLDNGMTVDCVGTAQDVLSKYNKRYRAVILDSMLPNDPALSGFSERETQGGFRSGLCVARKLRQTEPSIRLLIISANPSGTGVAEWCAKSNVPCISKADGEGALLGALERIGIASDKQTPRSFVVHGHDEVALGELKQYICTTLRWQAPIVLREQPSAGKTIIEKFEDNSHRADCVFVLLTPDDAPAVGNDKEAKRRSRQNVIFELGFFYGKLGRRSGRIFLLYKGKVDLPSDIHGIVWIDITKGLVSADAEIREELSAAKLLLASSGSASARAFRERKGKQKPKRKSASTGI